MPTSATERTSGSHPEAGGGKAGGGAEARVLAHRRRVEAEWLEGLTQPGSGKQGGGGVLGQGSSRAEAAGSDRADNGRDTAGGSQPRIRSSQSLLAAPHRPPAHLRRQRLLQSCGVQRGGLVVQQLQRHGRLKGRRRRRRRKQPRRGHLALVGEHVPWVHLQQGQSHASDQAREARPSGALQGPSCGCFRRWDGGPATSGRHKGGEQGRPRLRAVGLPHLPGSCARRGQPARAANSQKGY